MIDFTDLAAPLDEKPVFFVEEPDGQKHLTEIVRAAQFRRLMRTSAPTALVYANGNAGRRNPAQARREGIVAGVLDYTVVWMPSGHLLDSGVGFIELKGYDRPGRPGRLSQAQIDFGNRLTRLGQQVACFFDPERAVAWLRACGAPVRGSVS